MPKVSPAFEDFEIHEFPIEQMEFNTKNTVIGKPGTGKTTLITDIIYHMKHLAPVASVFSGTEDSNGYYRKMFPSLFVYNEYDETVIKDFIRRQKYARKYSDNPRAILLIDDCTDKPSVFTTPTMQYIYKNGRHLDMFYILSLQYCMDIKPVIRTNIDYTFILRETNMKNRKSLFENYAGVLGDFDLFNQVMDQVTEDYTALVIKNNGLSNEIKDNVFWYKATKHNNFQFGCQEFWDWNYYRYDPAYIDPVF